ncbi:hypothetical protein M419DRAFT_118318 [Trichoderma reesei RUT C-30]|uniref:Uncharacterized protein n=1 Tax=Hypocrea jecorina (strain ATCC 56765 / BCRC 32924 / NRRL 11460 / Rut C-30) TaxID=1344414 RepID=A0A024SFY8_HYPJR|nr:hypothetical protein M419DRAFT_118318 [Trichoderma reesei RUT C-30]
MTRTWCRCHRTLYTTPGYIDQRAMSKRADNSILAAIPPKQKGSPMQSGTHRPQSISCCESCAQGVS